MSSVNPSNKLNPETPSLTKLMRQCKDTKAHKTDKQTRDAKYAELAGMLIKLKYPIAFKLSSCSTM
jgi:hypothetical protein